MIDIPEPPTTLACAACMSPVVWLWSPRTEKWVKFATVRVGDDLLLRADRCAEEGHDRPLSWRDRPVTGHDPDAIERSHRGRALVDQALADAAGGVR